MKKIQTGDPESMSQDVVAQNIEQLRSLFPEAWTEGKLDFDVLKQLLGGVVDDREEKYGLNWHGKRKSRRLALTPSLGTLRPCPEESVDWETTQNLMIEGDNLEVLKLLQKSYSGKVKLIYIDPPYNTEGDFIYPDRYQDNLDTYLRYTGQIDDDGFKLSSATESSGRMHTNWLNMMLPRLKIARNLLRHDGVIICHMDEHEIANILWLFDEVFGPENNLGTIVWDKRNPKGDATRIATQHEYLVVYARDFESLRKTDSLNRPKANAERMLAKASTIFSKLGKLQVPDELSEIKKKYGLSLDLEKHSIAYDLDSIIKEYRDWLRCQDVSGGEAAYKYIDESGDVFRTVSMAWPNKQQAPDEYYIPLKHPITGNECPVPDRGWRNPPSTMKSLLDAGLIIFGDDETKQPERKYLLRENMYENIPSILPFGGSDDALLKELKIPFDTPKPVAFARSILQYFLGNNGIVLDFFAGSGTTGHACMELNLMQGSSHKYILVQLPERLDPNKKEQKAAHKFCAANGVPPNLAEVSKERLRRARLKISRENASFVGDLGFRAFKLDSSNINAWEPDRENLGEALLESLEHIKPDRNDADVLYELLLKLGLNLCVPIEQREIAKSAVYSIGTGSLIVYLASNISRDDAESVALGIVAWQKEQNPAGESTIVFRDSAFHDDVAKTNVMAILQQHGLVNVRSL